MAKLKLTDAEQVQLYMQQLQHPLKPETEAVRAIIKGVSDKIKERIKWNAPSYYYTHDFVTFNLRSPKHVHLVFHHPAIVNIQSGILEGDFKDRRMGYFRNMREVEEKKPELERVIRELLRLMDEKSDQLI